MLKLELIQEIQEKKKKGALNSALMKEYNISYDELRHILDDIKVGVIKDENKEA